ncbi:helix-turn-helix domain-containing protein [Paenibacillus antri]|uniref:Helix-turn-helix domain-containing protein n=1 Tax=Paenibacillus antri TaxID=2582848 RepID=A0A5R9GNR2_9BACL|nr:helix-turn-helix domain-containing protein [Paenibacillus antri]
MKPYRKPFFGDPLFPVDIVFQGLKKPENELPDHLHDRYELVYVHQGRGTFFIDETFYEKTAGDLFVIPGNTIHRSFPDEADPIVSTALFFAPALAAEAPSEEDGYRPLRCFESARKRKRYKLELAADARDDAERMLGRIHEELEGRRLGYREAVRLLLRELLLRLNRLAPAEGRSDGGPDLRIAPPWMDAVLRELDLRPGSASGLSELSRRANVSPAHFSRVFKRLTGMNVTDYLNAKRIVRAKELLRDSSEQIGEIAEGCGFDSMPHFHRVFKSLTGLTPGAYRKEHSGLAD